MSTTETWSAKLDVETKQKLNELIAAWRDDPTEPTTEVVDRIIAAAQTAGNGVPSEVLEASGEVKDTVMVLLKQVNSIGVASATALKDLHEQLDKQVEQNNDLREQLQTKIDQIKEGNKTVVQGLKDRITELKNDNDRLTKENSTSADALQGYKSSVASLTDQLAGAKDEIEKLKERLRVSAQDLKKVTDDLDKVRSAHDDEIHELKDQYEFDLKNKVEQQKEADESLLKAKVAELKVTAVQEQSEKLEKLHERLDLAKDEKLDLVKENGELKTRCDDLQRQLADLKKFGKPVDPTAKENKEKGIEHGN